MPDPTWPTPEAVEAAARVLSQASYPYYPWEQQPDLSRVDYRITAREALTALAPFIAAREATARREMRRLAEDMHASGNARPLGDPGADVWHKAARLITERLDRANTTYPAQEAPHE